MSAEYLGRIGETSFSGFLKFLLMLPAAGHPRKARRHLVHAARIVSSQHEDCGPCVQIAVNAALDCGVSRDLIRAILDRQGGTLPDDVRLAVDFAEAVLAADGNDSALRAQVESELGPRTLTELSIGIATARAFPTLKRGLGFATSCSAVEIDL